MDINPIKNSTHSIINWVKWVLTQLNSINININIYWILTVYQIRSKYHFYSSSNSKILQNHKKLTKYPPKLKNDQNIS